MALEFTELISNYQQERETPMFGIVVTNCTNEINLELHRLTSLPYFKLLSYLVCIVQPASPLIAGREEMQYYLDTQLYIHRYFKAKLNIKIIFRLAFGSIKLELNAEQYLIFMNDTNQYSEGYGIEYFMGNAFAAEELNTWSWCRASKNDYDEKLVVTELASDYFQRPTLQKYKVNPESVDLETPPLIEMKHFQFVIGLLISAFVFMGCLWFCNRKTKKMFLSEDEVNAFRNGEEISRKEESIGLNQVQVNTVKTLGFSATFEVPKKCIKLGNIIGEGNFGQVFIGTWKNKTKVAVKIPHNNCSSDSFKTILAEVKVLCYIGKHPNVVSFIGAYTKEIAKGVIYVITEFCKNGSLEKYLVESLRGSEIANNVVDTDADANGYFINMTVKSRDAQDGTEETNIRELVKFAYEISSGMEYISSKKVVHSDLSARNVLLDAHMTCKIGDFGLSRKLYENSHYVKKGTEALPWRWMAVESLQNMEFTTKSDVWSFGVTLWEIFSLGETPFSDITWHPDFVSKLFDGLRLSKPKNASGEIYSKMLECWRVSPEKRPTFDELRSHFEKAL